MLKNSFLPLALTSLFMIFSSEALAWPAGLEEFSKSVNPNFKILANKSTGEIAVLMRAPADKESFDDDTVANLKQQIICENYTVTDDRKAIMGEQCENKNSKQNNKLNMYTDIADNMFNTVIYSPSLSVNDAKAISSAR